MRMIDADALIADIKECIEVKDSNFEWEQVEGLEVALSCVDDAPTIEPEPHWILRRERLPEYSGRYLVSVLDGIDRRTTVAPYHPQRRTWTLTGRMAYWKVIAWMPLPEPYREGEGC